MGRVDAAHHCAALSCSRRGLLPWPLTRNRRHTDEQDVNVRNGWEADIGDYYCRMAQHVQKSVTSEAVEMLVEALRRHPYLTRSGAHFGSVTEARFHEINSGTVTWDWCDRHGGERGLRGVLAYYDLDHRTVSISLAKADNQVTEIELWRGDGNPILSMPQQVDLWEMVPGRIYSPRS